jgi:hypothetical protein
MMTTLFFGLWVVFSIATIIAYLRFAKTNFAWTWKWELLLIGLPFCSGGIVALAAMMPSGYHGIELPIGAIVTGCFFVICFRVAAMHNLRYLEAKHRRSQQSNSDE